MRVGILTIHAADNYGSVLQSYATQKALQNIGAEAVILDYRCPKISNEYGVKRILSQHGLKRKLEAALRVSIQKCSRKRFFEFRNLYYNTVAFDHIQQEMFDYYSGLTSCPKDIKS